VTGLLANVFEVPSNSPATKKFAWVGFRHPLDTYFVGREDELAKLQGYQSCERIKVAVISGLGGVGKSLLAFQYAKRKKDCSNCVWLRGEDKDTLFNSVICLARQIKLKTENCNGTREQFEETLTSIRFKINDSDEPWLIILDNMDSMHEFVAPTMNALWKEPNLFIIITSVLRNVASKRRTAELMELKGFSDEDSDIFINERLRNSKAELNGKLSATLQGLPLAMDQAVQYIVDQRNLKSLKGKVYGIEKFLDEFSDQKSAMEILDYKLEENEKTIFTTVKMCSDRIQALEDGENTVTLLHILSYLDPDGVPLPFLEGVIRITERTLDFLQNRLIVLKDFSLISGENETITIHRVVQRIVPLIQVAAAQRLLEQVAVGTHKLLITSKVFMFSQSERRQASILWNHLKKVDSVKGSESTYQCEKYRRLIFFNFPHLLNHNGIDMFANDIGDLLNNKWGLHDGIWLFSCAQLCTLKHLIELEILPTLIPAFIEEYGENHPDVLNFRMKLLYSQRDFKIDVNYLEELGRLIAIAEQQLENGHPQILNMKCKLAEWLYEDQKYTHALDVAKDTQSFLKVPDPMYYKIGHLKVNCYKAQGDDIRASELHEEQTRKLDALREDKRLTHLNENSSGDKEEDIEKQFLLVKQTFPKFYELLSGLGFKRDNRNQRIELQSSIVFQHNPIATSEATRSEADIHQEAIQTRLSAVAKAQHVTIRQFQVFFSNGPNMATAMKFLEFTVKMLTILLSKE
jgi:hypothetical protein